MATRVRYGQFNDRFDQQPTVIDGFSHLILDVFGPEVGRHPRSAVGMPGLPFDLPVETEAEVSIRAINE
jgi:hypothetical protein